MFDPENSEHLDERLEALSVYAADIDDLELRAKAFKELRDVIIVGLVESGVSSREIARAAGVSHVRVAAIAKASSVVGLGERQSHSELVRPGTARFSCTQS